MLLGIARVPSPIGPLTLLASDAGLCALAFDDHESAADLCRRRFLDVEIEPRPDPAGAASALAAYFAGDVRALEDVPVDLGGTPFQKSVWEALRRIPAGETRSYKDLALAIGSPRAVRAVGLANSQNPVAIVVPCHRVIRADGRLCGYGGGIPRKRWLLAHERALPPSELQPALFEEGAVVAT